jgi:hypothetical protein
LIVKYLRWRAGGVTFVEEGIGVAGHGIVLEESQK